MVYVYCTLNYSTFKTVIGVLGRDWPYLFLKSYKKWIPTFNILDWEVEEFPSKSRTLLEWMSMKKERKDQECLLLFTSPVLMSKLFYLNIAWRRKKGQADNLHFQKFLVYEISRVQNRFWKQIWLKTSVFGGVIKVLLNQLITTVFMEHPWLCLGRLIMNTHTAFTWKMALY